MNVFGAVGFIINGWWHGAIPNAAMNVVWAAIGVFTLLRIRARRESSGPGA